MTQSEVDLVVDRIRKLVAKYGGQSDELAEVRKWYQIYKACPESMSFIVLEAEVEKLEKLQCQNL